MDFYHPLLSHISATTRHLIVLLFFGVYHHAFLDSVYFTVYFLYFSSCPKSVDAMFYLQGQTDNDSCDPSFLLSLQREELTEVILKLLVAWGDPLWHFHQSLAHNHEFSNFSSNKSLEMSDMVHELRKGVQKVIEKVLILFPSYLNPQCKR